MLKAAASSSLAAALSTAPMRLDSVLLGRVSVMSMVMAQLDMAVMAGMHVTLVVFQILLMVVKGALAGVVVGLSFMLILLSPEAVMSAVMDIVLPTALLHLAAGEAAAVMAAVLLLTFQPQSAEAAEGVKVVRAVRRERAGKLKGMGRQALLTAGRLVLNAVQAAGEDLAVMAVVATHLTLLTAEDMRGLASLLSLISCTLSFRIFLLAAESVLRQIPQVLDSILLQAVAERASATSLLKGRCNSCSFSIVSLYS